MKKWILRIFSGGWLTLSIFAIAQVVQNGQSLVTIFMFVQCIIAWRFCERTWDTDAHILGQ